MKSTVTVIHRALAMLFALMLVVTSSCTNNDDDNDDHFIYTGTIDHSCGYLILLEKDIEEADSTNFIKPVNLDNSFEIHGLKVKVTFSYIGEKQMDCLGGFIGIPEKVEIIEIKKL